MTTELSPELASAVEAAVALRPDAFPTRSTFLEEAVSRLVDELAGDPAAFEARGVDYQSIRLLLERWMDARLGGSEVADDKGQELSDYLRGPVEVTHLAALGPHEAGGLTDTELMATPPGVSLDANGPEFVLETGPLFGLHNRDYPSLWAAVDLYREAAAKPVDLDSYLRDLTERGWEFGAFLSRLEKATGLSKLQALFPSNRKRAQSAEEGFRAFAFGSIHSIRGGDQRRLAGPIYQWQLARVELNDQGRVLVGRTQEGESLLDDLAGLSLVLPHEEGFARTFLRHLMQFAPGDWEVFRAVLVLCGQSHSRPTLVEKLRIQFSERNWSESAGSSYAVGYVGRAREWGLLEQRLSADRTYELTELGREYADA